MGRLKREYDEKQKTKLTSNSHDFDISILYFQPTDVIITKEWDLSSELRQRLEDRVKTSTVQGLVS